MRDGREIRGAKRDTIDAGTHVPMIAWQPGVVKPGRRVDRLTSLADFLPTLAEAAGIPKAECPPTDGRSFLPTLRGEAVEDPEFLAFHYHPGKGDYPKRRWVRTQQYKLYSDGRFYDTDADPLEETALKSDGLSEDVATVQSKLQAELDTLGWKDDLAKPGDGKKAKKK